MLCERCYYKEYIDCDMKLLKHENLLEANLTSILWEKDARTVNEYILSLWDAGNSEIRKWWAPVDHKRYSKCCFCFENEELYYI